MFKVGDKVVCVSWSGCLTVGKEYEIVSIYNDWYRVINDIGEIEGYTASRFKLSEANKPTLLETINYANNLDLKENEIFRIIGNSQILYKFENEELLVKSNNQKNWEEATSLHEIFKHGVEKVEEKKFYLKAKDWRVISSNEDDTYFNLDDGNNSMFWEDLSETSNCRTQFTLEEIKELKKDPINKARIEFCNLIEVENEKA